MTQSNFLVFKRFKLFMIEKYVSSKNPNHQGITQFIKQMTELELQKAIEYLQDFETIGKIPEIEDLYYDSKERLVISVKFSVTILN